VFVTIEKKTGDVDGRLHDKENVLSVIAGLKERRNLET